MGSGRWHEPLVVQGKRLVACWHADLSAGSRDEASLRSHLGSQLMFRVGRGEPVPLVIVLLVLPEVTLLAVVRFAADRVAGDSTAPCSSGMPIPLMLLVYEGEKSVGSR